MAGPASLGLLKPKSKTVAPEAQAETQAAETKPAAVAKPVAKPAVAKPAPKPAEAEVQETAQATAQEPASEAASETIEIKNMTGAELDKLVKEQEIATPDTWAKMKVAEKKAWLEEQFGDGSDGSAEGAAEQTSEVQAASPTAPADEAKAGQPEAQAKPAKVESKTAKALDAGKPTGKAAVKVVHGEIMEGKDALHDMVYDIENLKEKEAKELVTKLLSAGGEGEFKVGGILAKVMDNGWYTPYASFREFVENEHGLHYRKALNLIEIYNALIEAKVPWDKIKHLGWTKIHRIAKVLSEENAKLWIEVAEKQTVLQLEDTVKNAKDQAAKGSASDAVEEKAEVKTVTTMTFKLHDDQKATIEAAIAKAKEVGSTQVATVALEYICMDFLGGAKAVPLKDQMVKLGLEGVLGALEQAFPDTNFSVVAPEE